MKKVLLVLLCCATIVGALSCNKINDTNLEISQDEHSLEKTTYDHAAQKSGEDSITAKINATFDSYDSIINTYKKMIAITPDVIEEKEIHNEKIKSIFYIDESKMDWFSRLTTSISNLYPRDVEGLKNNGYSDFGYAIKDINGDDFDELILMLSDGTIVAIFTIHNNEPVLLDTFQNRYYCSLSSAGEIFISGSNGAAQTVNRKYILDATTDDLLLICEYGTEGFDPITGETIFYVNINSTKTYLTETEYDEVCEKNPVMPASQLLEFLTYQPLF